jgi:hypothetical protein
MIGFTFLLTGKFISCLHQVGSLCSLDRSEAYATEYKARVAHQTSHTWNAGPHPTPSRSRKAYQRCAGSTLGPRETIKFNQFPAYLVGVLDSEEEFPLVDFRK